MPIGVRSFGVLGVEHEDHRAGGVVDDLLDQLERVRGAFAEADQRDVRVAVPHVELLGGRMAIIEFEARSERLVNGTCLVWVAGELDLHTAPELERALLAAATEAPGPVMVDLSGCTFMDSTALAILVEASRRLDGANGRLTIIAAAPAILRPFQITGLDRLFVFYPTRMAALSGESR